MLGKTIWEMETVNWVDPLAVPYDEFRELYPETPVGLTTNQFEDRTSYHFQIVRLVSPKEFLFAVDPRFEGRPRNTGPSSNIAWLLDRMESGFPFAPLQIWLDPEEFAFFPKDAWWTDRGEYLGGHLQSSLEKLSPTEYSEKIVRSHEGRHRALLSAQLGETQIPVSVWVRYRKYEG